MRRYEFKIKTLLVVLVVFAGALSQGCSTNKQLSRKVKRIFKHSEVLNKHFAGFALYDIASKEMILERNADKYFTPASNTKLFTFYAGLKILQDSVPGLRYIEQGDSIIFWGTGDPSLLHQRLKGNKAVDFLRNTNKKVFFAQGRYKGNFYGAGWQWDDYNDYYQAEINELPISGNLVEFKVLNDSLTAFPALFTQDLYADSSIRATSFFIKRDFDINRFKYPVMKMPAGFAQEIPYKVNLSTTLELLRAATGKNVETIDREMPLNAKTIYSVKADSIFKEMMLPSDNFIAEQLLLTYSDKIGEKMSPDKVIEHVKKHYLKELPDDPVWVDGSGLSCYNLFTPRDIVKLLELIYREVNDPKRLFSMLPAGGKTGTLKNAYPKTDDPFVFGKTGTLSNVHSQSGYVITKKKRLYIFSFMNNNFISPTSSVRSEMGKIITFIHDNF